MGWLVLGLRPAVENGVLKHTYIMMGIKVYNQTAGEPLPTGEVNVRLEFAADAAKTATGGQARLLVNDDLVGEGRMDNTVPWRFSGYAGMDIGRDNGLPVSRSYAEKSPFPFTGTVKKAVFNIKPHLTEADEHEVHKEVHQGLVAHGISA